MANVGQNMQCAYTSDAEEILTFIAFKSFEKQVVYETDDN
jgi:hypothetical protein